MNIRHRFKNNIPVLIIPPEDPRLVKDDIDDFISSALSINRSGSEIIAFDMSQKPYLNSSGLSDLIKSKDVFLDSGIDLVLISPSQKILSLLEMVGLDDFFTIVNSEDDL